MAASHTQQNLDLGGDETPPASVERAPTGFVAVAVPVPGLDLLTYSVPAAEATVPQPGMRCRVPLGKRVIEGMIVEVLESAPSGVRTRPIEEIVDRHQVLSDELLQLGRFVSDYYLTGIGEVLKSMLPTGIGSWGRERVRITNAGALAHVDEPLATRVLEQLRDGDVHTLGSLSSGMPLDRLWPVINDLEQRGWIRYQGRSKDRGQRFGRAYELAPLNDDELVQLCGRSKPGRTIVRMLLELGRPAGQDELLAAADCGAGVLRRLVRLGVLREFVEVRSLDLSRHRLSSVDRKAESGFKLTDEQQAASDAICADIDDRRAGRFLLHGVTGSGKTEVYLRAAERALSLGRTTLILVPEIALVPALAQHVRERFGDCHAILHSGLSRQERAQEWQRIRSGAAKVVVGPRSALFAPLDEPGLIVVDEEHDPSYKQENSPRYHGRDVAYVRAANVGATLVLGSATPSMESRHNVSRTRLELLTMHHRVGEARLPEGVVVDLRQEQRPRRPGEIVFSRTLINELQQCLDNGRQAILLRNRRGYAPVLLCSVCGHDHPCVDCGLAQTIHRKDGRLHCHYCGASRPVPERCAECASPEIDAVGAGTERVHEQVLELFPEASVEVLDRDTAQGGGLREILERFSSGDRDILVGTQMVAKGHHFPNVALSAVLNADTYLSFPDFRGVERAYALIAQLAGRAGRGEIPGKVVIQTRQPDHYAIRAALDSNDALFAAREDEFRSGYGHPPYSRLIEIVVEDRNRGRARDAALSIGERLRTAVELTEDTAAPMRIIGPQAPPHERLAGRWRFQLLVSGTGSARMRAAVAAALPASSATRIRVDVDPYSLF